jgi:hypothetical protein
MKRDRIDRREPGKMKQPAATQRTVIRWVTVKGGFPPGLDVADRARMAEWLNEDRRAPADS